MSAGTAESAELRTGPGRLWLRSLLIAVGAVMTGCAVNPSVDLAEIAPRDEPFVLESVPFHPQTEYQCGPAALAGLLGSAGVDITPEELSPQVFLPERKGSLQIELVAATRRAGRIAYKVDPDLRAIIGELEDGRPVLVLQNLGTHHYPVWHYALVVGIDPAGNRVYLNSGKEEHKAMRGRAFQRTWDWADRWALIALTPGELPTSRDPLHYFRAVAAFENASDDLNAARAAWNAAIPKWPDDPHPHLALGNLALQTGDHDEAITHFRRGLELKPGDAVLENNLAEATAAAGCPHTAEVRLADYLEGLDADSPWYENLSETLFALHGRSDEDFGRCAGYAES